MVYICEGSYWRALCLSRNASVLPLLRYMIIEENAFFNKCRTYPRSRTSRHQASQAHLRPPRGGLRGALFDREGHAQKRQPLQCATPAIWLLWMSHFPISMHMCIHCQAAFRSAPGTITPSPSIATAVCNSYWTAHARCVGVGFSRASAPCGVSLMGTGLGAIPAPWPVNSGMSALSAAGAR